MGGKGEGAYEGHRRRGGSREGFDQIWPSFLGRQVMRVTLLGSGTQTWGFGGPKWSAKNAQNWGQSLGSP